MEPLEQPQKIVSYRDLKVWQKGMDLVELTYDLACKLPPSEKYGLAAQMCRAAVSIPSNIAEGWGRKHRAEYINHLSMANGSLKELETQILICIRLRQIQETDAEQAPSLAEEVGRMLAVLIQKLRAKAPRPR
ncbi:MAG: four helix bundle protein [Candidatus Acidiferrales bacterium]